jgi:hypothetical protein
MGTQSRTLYRGQEGPDCLKEAKAKNKKEGVCRAESSGVDIAIPGWSFQDVGRPPYCASA